ncbi:unnamed protein product [Vitrella brassicaformis CCMP3155]|uniref:Uncharacterized protein n=1 Tax=Vitrella brassicaformis (strain CCMP3155) TaxID=1169540 RepID=A0A0G4FHB5_VITBC|nr:unnamed protein product [Vitrella brassicaformis CCMP3155]|eukprot:CEM12817.1 unnamed protein product [Vitrella brassicaformis CCMP3155]
MVVYSKDTDRQSKAQGATFEMRCYEVLNDVVLPLTESDEELAGEGLIPRDALKDFLSKICTKFRQDEYAVEWMDFVSREVPSVESRRPPIWKAQIPCLTSTAARDMKVQVKIERCRGDDIAKHVHLFDKMEIKRALAKLMVMAHDSIGEAADGMYNALTESSYTLPANIETMRDNRNVSELKHVWNKLSKLNGGDASAQQLGASLPGAKPKRKTQRRGKKLAVPESADQPSAAYLQYAAPALGVPPEGAEGLDASHHEHAALHEALQGVPMMVPQGVPLAEGVELLGPVHKGIPLAHHHPEGLMLPPGAHVHMVQQMQQLPGQEQHVIVQNVEGVPEMQMQGLQPQVHMPQQELPVVPPVHKTVRKRKHDQKDDTQGEEGLSRPKKKGKQGRKGHVEAKEVEIEVAGAAAGEAAGAVEGQEGGGGGGEGQPEGME